MMKALVSADGQEQDVERQQVAQRPVAEDNPQPEQPGQEDHVQTAEHDQCGGEGQGCDLFPVIMGAVFRSRSKRCSRNRNRTRQKAASPVSSPCW